MEQTGHHSTKLRTAIIGRIRRLSEGVEKQRLELLSAQLKNLPDVTGWAATVLPHALARQTRIIEGPRALPAPPPLALTYHPAEA